MLLFCLPYAGGTARLFRGWRPYLRRGVTMMPLDRAGQGSRRDEPAHPDFGAAVADVVGRIAATVAGQPYAIYGHSLGGLLAYEASLRLVAAGSPAPRWLFVGGCRPPQLSRRHPDIHRLADQRFLAALAVLGGVPDGLLADPEAVEFYAGRIRADYRIYEEYRFRPPPAPVPCPLTAIVGTDDPVTGPDEAPRWAELVSGPVHRHVLAGAGHFTIEQRPAQIVGHLNSVLGRLSAAPAGQL